PHVLFSSSATNQISPLSLHDAFRSQTISQPYIVAAMIEATQVKAGDRVLEVGAGSGYAAAVIGQIAEHVHAIERHATLALAAKQDRKSTRLNSSHVKISYAVFCLKK